PRVQRVAQAPDPLPPESVVGEPAVAGLVEDLAQPLRVVSGREQHGDDRASRRPGDVHPAPDADLVTCGRDRAREREPLHTAALEDAVGAIGLRRLRGLAVASGPRHRLAYEIA